MDQLIQMVGQFVEQHPHVAVLIVIGLWLLSNVVSSMPSPDQSSGAWYKFLFTLGHSLMGSLGRVIPSLRLPSDPTRQSQPFFKNDQIKQ